MKLPILRGSLRGRWWLPAASEAAVRVLLATYEKRQAALFRAMVRPGHTVLDVGAGVGYYTLLAAQLTGVTGRVVAFEPDARSFRYLERHLAMNRCVNVTTEPSVVALDTYVRQKRLRPDVLRVDMEDLELEVLRGGADMLRGSRPTLFLSTHGAEANRACRALLAGLGYDVLGIDHDDPAASAHLLCVDALSVPPVPR